MRLAIKRSIYSRQQATLAPRVLRNAKTALLTTTNNIYSSHSSRPGGLYRCTLNSSRTTYSIAYRSAFIRPNSNAPAVDYNSYLPPGTVIIDLNNGTDTPPEMVVEAEELCFLTGTAYEYKGKNLTIRCSNLVFMRGPNDSPATINLLGVDPDPAPIVEMATADSGKDAYMEPSGFGYSEKFFYFQENAQLKEATKGADGAEGSPGSRGSKGGDMTITCESVVLPEISTPLISYLKLISHGGKGQDGGRGNGIKFEVEAEKLKWGYWSKRFIAGSQIYQIKKKGHGYGFEATVQYGVSFDFRTLVPVFPPAPGGRPGHGGTGGPGGDGGNLKVYFRDSKLTNGLVRMIITHDLAAGVDSDDGQEGVPGDSGSNGSVLLQGDLPKGGSFDRRVLFKSLNSMGSKPPDDRSSWVKHMESSMLCGENNHSWPIEFNDIPAVKAPDTPLSLVNDPKTKGPKKAEGKCEIEVKGDSALPLSSFGYTPS
ncbi:hypothetical protein GGR58DRAFT_497910 [Xylaria digitata]|nr:hypothetical protein GGR58DRAFT_497910 [Xylaria digitata]